MAITLDALVGETFTGTVSSIGTGSSESTGVSKYSVTVVVPKEENMLAGMTASATVIVDSSEDVFVIPAAAVQEAHGEIFVYTELDEEGNPAGKVTVETGLSDGSKVEVSGKLTQGQTVYYTEATGSDIETEEEETSERGEMGQMGDFGGLGGPGGSGGPNGSGGSGGPGGSGGSGGSAQRPSGNGGGPGA